MEIKFLCLHLSHNIVTQFYFFSYITVMKKVIINNYAWYVNERTGVIYEFVDGTGAVLSVNNFNSQEINQLKNQL